MKIHIFGASGSGTTTIAKTVCGQLGYRHFDADDYFWLPADDPVASFTAQRPTAECLNLLTRDLTAHENWILSGSLTGWGEILIPFFELAVFVYVPQDLRLERLKKREYERYGDAVLPGGKRYRSSADFLAWAASYDAGTQNGRSLQKHEKWLEKIEYPVIRVINRSLDDSVNIVIKAVTEGT